MVMTIARFRLVQRLPLLMFALALVHAPVLFAASECADLSGTPIHFNVSWQTDIKPIINELISPTGRCTSCHSFASPSGGLDLSDTNYDAIYKVVNNVVTPGDPADSRMFIKTNCGSPDSGSQMPLGGTPLSIAERELIYDWINQGAYGEDPDSIDGPIGRDFIFRADLESTRFMRP